MPRAASAGLSPEASGMGDELQKKLGRYFKSRTFPGILSAYLFGSHGEDRAHSESDVDVGVLLDRGRYASPRARFHARVRLASDLIHALRKNDLDVIVLNDAPPALRMSAPRIPTPRPGASECLTQFRLRSSMPAAPGQWQE